MTSRQGLAEDSDVLELFNVLSSTSPPRHFFFVGIYLFTHCSSSWSFLSQTRGELSAVLTLYFHFSSTENEKRERSPLGNRQPFLVSQALVHLASTPSVHFSARLLISWYPENMQQLLYTLHWKHEAF